MRFEIDFDKGDERRPTMRALREFLNEHLIGTLHGAGLTAIFLDLVDGPAKKKYRKGLLYGEYAQIELPFEFGRDSKCVEEFVRAFDKVFEAVGIAVEIPLKRPGFANERLIEDLERARRFLPTDQTSFDAYLARCDEIGEANRIRRARMLQDARRNNMRPCTKPLSGVRIYALGACEDADLHAADFAETYENLLDRADVRTPGYSEIYIYVAPTLDEAVTEIALESWYECTQAEVDLNALGAVPAVDRLPMLAAAYGAALRRIAEIDHLDLVAIESVLDSVSAKGLDRDLSALRAESESHRAEVLYNVTHRAPDGKIPYRLRVTCKTTGRQGEVALSSLASWSAPYSLGKLALLKREVVVKARTSAAARITLEREGLPKEFRFTIADMLGERCD